MLTDEIEIEKPNVEGYYLIMKKKLNDNMITSYKTK